MKKVLQTASGFTVGDIRAHKRLCRTVAGLSSFLMLTTLSAPAFADTSVLGGDATLTGATGASLNTGSATDSYAQFVADAGATSAVLDWSKFDISAVNKRMDFDGAGTTFFNLVSGASKSQINGMISSDNGSVWVINPNGIAFGAGAQVNVSGLFAAAAGNLSNADALRDGTATRPVFSSLAGKVSTDAGSKFTADQVALMGKTVSVAGDFTKVNSVDVGAAERIEVENVQGGRITVKVADFAYAADPTSVSAELGDLQVGDVVEGLAGGNLTVRTENAVKVKGTVTTGGPAYVLTKNGDITVSENAAVRSVGYYVGEVDLFTGMSTGGKGDISIDGEVSATYVDPSYAGYGTVYAYAGFGDSTKGAAAGDITVKGRVAADDLLDMSAFCGQVDLAQGSVLKSHGGSVRINAHTGINVAGRVENTSNVSGEHVQMTTDRGDVVICGGEGSGVKSDGQYGRIDIAAGMQDATEKVPVSGNVEILGDLYAKYAIDIEAGAGENAQGKVNAAGKLEGETAVEITGATGIDVSGTVTAGTQTWLETKRGDINLISKSVVKTTGDGGKTILTSGIVEGGSGDINISGEVSAEGTVNMRFQGNEILLDSPGVYVRGAVGKGAKGTVVVESTGNVHADRQFGKVEIANATGENAEGDVTVNGKVSSALRSYVASAYGKNSKGNVVVNGDVSVSGKNGTTDDQGYAIVLVGYGEGASVDVTVNGKVTATHDKGMVSVQAASGTGAKGDIHVNGELSGGKDVNVVTYDGDIDIAGKVESRVDQGTAEIWALNGIQTKSDDSGNISFGAGGMVAAKAEVDLVARGNITQKGVPVVVHKGVAADASYAAAVSSKAINIKADGSVGTRSQYLAVDGGVKGIVQGDMYVAAAGGDDFVGGAKNAQVNVTGIQMAQEGLYDVVNKQETSRKTVDVSPIAEEFNGLAEGALVVGGNLGVYTSGVLKQDSLFYAGGNITVSASSFGDVSYLQAGGRLTINNVGKPAYPQIAYFESIDGVEPRLNNQPNDVVIFVDGRLAGGNLKILNQFGANEAFLVSTPELKSTQGIFGNPTFLHSDLDVANPMEVSAIDYMLQETPRLTLDKDFPKEVDQHVDSVVIPEKDSIQFGREAKAESAPAADDTVAMLK